MPHIQQLDPHLADLIAAGEVVERPASVVKELVENAVDAGASALTVEIQNGGMALIRVTDNGCGIPAAEAETAFLRHATSKLSSERDLEAIGTLGFRGEALAAIAAVSRVELLTRTEEEELGTALTLEGGLVADREEAGCPAGTTMLVRNLFYNTPARLKFMKKDAAEGAAVFAAVQRQALARPEISLRFLRDGTQELLTPGDGQLKSAVYSVLGRDNALGLIEVNGSGEEMSVAGFSSLPACCKGTRGSQFFFVNGRCVKSRTMTAALEEAYQNQKMVGKFPACVLHLTTKLSAVDVNVHPTKQEVKFGNERQVFNAVYYAVLSALEGNHTRVRAQLERPRPHDSVTPNQTAFHTMTAAEYREGAPLPLHDFTAPSAGRIAARPARTPFSPSPLPRQAEEREKFPAGGLAPERTAASSAGPISPVEYRSSAPGKLYSAPPTAAGKPSEDDKIQPEVRAEPLPERPAGEITPWRLAGEILNTYIIVEQGDKILLIDKHAAHERMNFDRLKAQSYESMSQSLLKPLVFTPPAEEGAALLEHLPLLSEFGFDAEDFGGGAVLVRRAPCDVAEGEIESVLTGLAAVLLTTGRADPAAARDALLHTMACKAAIKGGQRNGPEELERVAEAVVRGEVKYCPHGRPVAIELTRAQLEKQFKRA